MLKKSNLGRVSEVSLYEKWYFRFVESEDSAVQVFFFFQNIKISVRCFW
jgi:hypothetical protein